MHEYGAKGDGAADDTEAIQAAMNIQVKEVVYFPRMRYRIGIVTIPAGVEQVIGGDAFISTKWNNEHQVFR